MFTCNTPNGGISYMIIHDGRLIEVITAHESSGVRVLKCQKAEHELVNLAVDAIDDTLNNVDKATIVLNHRGIFNGVYRELDLNLTKDGDNFNLVIFHVRDDSKDSLVGKQDFMKLDNICGFVRQWFFDDQADTDTLLAMLMR